MNLGKKEGIVVVGEIQKREIMPLTLELIGAAGKLSKERNLSLSVILSGCGIKEEAKKLYNYGVDEIDVYKRQQHRYRQSTSMGHLWI